MRQEISSNALESEIRKSKSKRLPNAPISDCAIITSLTRIRNISRLRKSKK